jgi:hypothetical protein
MFKNILKVVSLVFVIFGSLNSIGRAQNESFQYDTNFIARSLDEEVEINGSQSTKDYTPGDILNSKIGGDPLSSIIMETLNSKGSKVISGAGRIKRSGERAATMSSRKREGEKEKKNGGERKKEIVREGEREREKEIQRDSPYKRSNAPGSNQTKGEVEAESKSDLPNRGISRADRNRMMVLNAFERALIDDSG